MALDTIQFVDSIASAPTVALDLNSSSGDYLTKLVSFTPGQMRYAMSDNAMSDGVFVSSSTAGAGQLVLELDLGTTTQDLNATALQTLARQLDKPTNLIKYQPNGLTKPVFFQTFRCTPTQITDIMVAAARRYITVTLMTQPYALGLREDISVGTVNNDPAHATNGCYFDIAAASCIGDVPAPVVIVDTITANTDDWHILGVRQHGTPSDGTFWSQGESMTLGAGVTNPGGGPDGTMSGTGTNNYVRTSGGAANCTATWTLGTSTAALKAQRGTYRLLLTVRQSSGTDVFQITTNGGTAVTVPSSTARQIVDMGIVSVGLPVSANPGGLAVEGPTIPSGAQTLLFTRASGAGTIDLDCAQLIPADECQTTWETEPSVQTVLDSGLEAAYLKNSGDLFGGAVNFGTQNTDYTYPVSGGFPFLRPSQINRFFWVRADVVAGVRTITKGNTSSLTVSYWPRYVFVRPSTT
jgi:hypothetical protein